jgi:hypothetical protein
VAETTGIAEALWNVQKALPPLGKDSTATIPTKSGGSFSYKYVSLDHLMEKVLPLLNEHKLVLIQSPTWVPEQGAALRTKLVHYPSGEVETDVMLLAANGASPQDQGSAITYARRYALMSMLGLVADEDKDGQVSHARGGEKGEGMTTAQRGKIFGLIKDLGETLKQNPPAPHADWKAATEARCHELWQKPLKDLTKDEASTLIESMTAHIKSVMEVPVGETPFQPPEGVQAPLVPAEDPTPF